MKLTGYLGGPGALLRGARALEGTEFDRREETDLPSVEVYYVAKGRGFEFICDADERVRTIFVRPGSGVHPEELDLCLGRVEVLAKFGEPERSGKAVRDPILGERGAWDRFAFEAYSLHVLYSFDESRVQQLTLMRADVVPG